MENHSKIVAHAGRQVLGSIVALAWVTAPLLALDLETKVAETLDEWQAPGAVVVIVRDGDVVHARGYGLADPDIGRRVDADATVFRLGSISKPVTAAAAMRLQQEGRLDLEAPVDHYLRPHFASAGTARPLTTAHLLTHTGGFGVRFLTRLTEPGKAMPELGEFLARDLPPRIYPPGEVSLYSNFGVALAGLVVSEVVSKPFPEAMRELVFEPLGMTRSSFSLGSELADDLAQGHRSGRPVEAAGIKTVPASMLAATGSDMARFIRALVAPETASFLSAETVERMLERRFAHHPSHTGRAYGWAEDSAQAPRRLFHSGGVDGFSSGIVLVPEARGGVFVAFNGNAWVWGLIRAILDEHFPRHDPPEPTTSRVAGTVPGFAAGRWAPAELPRHTFDKARLLFEQDTVEADGTDAISFRGRRYAPRIDGSFASAEGGFLVLRKAAGERPALLLVEGGVYRKLAWHEGWPLHGALAALFLAGFLGLVLDRPFRLRRSSGPLIRRCLFLAGLLNLLFLVSMGALMGITMAQDGGVLRFRIPWYLLAILSLPLVTAGLSASAGTASLARFIGGGWDRALGWRVALALALVASFPAFVAYWNLLGFHFHNPAAMIERPGRRRAEP